ncbi:hypothetical protein [Xanthobacter sp. KR7-225]|uniref:hypothetical protein n=1 Tax=Xanthobacter sp. KR7-225 TaxID=3156613 RepID=UPI0032B51373
MVVLRRDHQRRRGDARERQVVGHIGAVDADAGGPLAQGRDGGAGRQDARALGRACRIQQPRRHADEAHHQRRGDPIERPPEEVAARLNHPERQPAAPARVHRHRAFGRMERRHHEHERGDLRGMPQGELHRRARARRQAEHDGAGDAEMVEQRGMGVRLRGRALIFGNRRAQIAEARRRDGAHAVADEAFGDGEALVEAAAGAMDGEQGRAFARDGILDPPARQVRHRAAPRDRGARLGEGGAEAPRHQDGAGRRQSGDEQGGQHRGSRCEGLRPGAGWRRSSGWRRRVTRGREPSPMRRLSIPPSAGARQRAGAAGEDGQGPARRSVADNMPYNY